LVSVKTKNLGVCRSENAFTLVELLVATALVSLVVTGIYSLSYTGSGTWEKSVIYQENMQNLRQAMRSLEADISYAGWVWLGENWEQHWIDTSYDELFPSGEIYYGFYGEQYEGEGRPHFVFYRIWLAPNNTLYLRKSVLLTELNSTYYINPAPYPLADNLDEILFSYEDNNSRIIMISIITRVNQMEKIELNNKIHLRNLSGYSYER